MNSNNSTSPTNNDDKQGMEDVYVFPMSFAQQRLWVIDQIFPGTTAYNILQIYRVSGDLDLELMQKSIDFIVERHESLRTTFTRHKGEPVQVIHPEMRIDIKVHDFRSLSAQASEEEARQVIDQVSITPFDLLHGPLFHCTVIRIDDRQAYWLVEMHHIISDARSMAVFFDEFLLCYKAYQQGDTPGIAPLPVQYADYTVWQREWLASGVRETQMAYWRTQLENRPPRLNLPMKDGTEYAITDAGQRQRYELKPESIEELRAIGRSRNATLFMTLLAAFFTLLYRYTGQTDLSVGIPIANRTRVEIERLIGYFVNTLVIRVDLSGRPTFQTVLERVRKATLDSYQNQDLPFEELVKEFEKDRSSPRNPLAQILFNHITDFTDPDSLPSLTFKRVPQNILTAIFDISILIRPHPDGQTVYNIRYSTELFDAKTIERFFTHYERLLEAIIADPALPIAQYAMLTEAEHEKVITDWNTQTQSLPEGQSLPLLFAEQVRRRPEAEALIDHERRLTYQALDYRADQIASRLRSDGVQKGDIVGLFLPRSAEWVTAVLGVMRAGAVYLPLAVEDPMERIRQILDDSGAKIIIARSDSPFKLEGWTGSCLHIDEAWFEQQGPVDPAPAADTGSEDPIYLMYTSGSTGLPKGVVIPQRAIMALVLDADYMRLDASTVMSHVSNIAFDVATLEIWGPLINGGCVVILDKDEILSPTSLRQAIDAYEINNLFLPTALFHKLAALQPDLFKGLETVIFGGEAGDLGTIRQVLEGDPPERLVNGYGPTETTSFSLWFETHELDPDDKVLPIGQPLTRTTAYVVDQDFNPVPIGVAGELVIGGPGVALGYYHRPELTAERFVPDIFGSDPDRTLYRTGDLARYREDGRIDFLGRLDDQVKLNGFRVEPGEIEYVIKQMPGVQDAFVRAIEGERHEKQIIAYIVADQQAVQEEQVQTYVRDKLPHYMIPRHILILDSFPLTANGKVDRQALPVPETSGRADRVTPRNEVEAQLLDIWREVLAIDEIGIHDDFFAMGGHSLLAISLLSQIESTFHQEVALSLLFDAPTIALQAKTLQAAAVEGTQSLVPMRPNGQRRPLYVIHPGGGLLFTYTDLVKHFPEELPVFGLQAQGLRGEAEPHHSIGEMAAHYVKAIRRHQPKGPYQLCGFSGGGVIAYEMAVQLQAIGEETSALIMLDAILGQHPYSQVEAPATPSNEIGERLAGLGDQIRQSLAADRDAMRHQPAGQKLSFAVKRIAHHWEWQVMRRITGLMKQSTDDTDPTQHPEWEPEKKVLWAIRHALTDYQPTPYDGKVTYIQAGDNQRPNAYRVWEELVREQDVVRLEGNHLEIVKGDQAADLAGLIDDLLEA